MTSTPWTPNLPLTANASDLQIMARRTFLNETQMPGRGMGYSHDDFLKAHATVAREFAAACVAASEAEVSLEFGNAAALDDCRTNAEKARKCMNTLQAMNAPRIRYSCPKEPHSKPEGGYLHSEDDDSPYSIDGQRYCGHCHYSCDARGRCENPAGVAGRPAALVDVICHELVAHYRRGDPKHRTLQKEVNHMLNTAKISPTFQRFVKSIAPPSEHTKCLHCMGEGSITDLPADGEPFDGFSETVQDCPQCYGAGHVFIAGGVIADA